MVEGRLLAAAAVMTTLAVFVWGPWRAPKDPEQLFRKRCRTCHVLPDLTGFHRKDIRPTVNTMRERNGADKVISAAEAERIIAYLEGVTQP